MAGKKGPRSPRALQAAADRKDRGDRLRALFAKNLRDARIAMDINQSELARAASKHRPKKDPIGRDLISNYERAHSMPNDTHLAALAKVFDMQPEELLPRQVPAISPPANPPGFQVQQTADGMAWLRVNQRVPMRIAMKVIALLDTPTDPS